MTTNEQIEKQANHIANAIVDLDERADRPVISSVGSTVDCLSPV
jgi:hypothetical protein